MSGSLSDNWIKVSIQASRVILSLKDINNNYKILSSKSIDKLYYILYNSGVYCNDIILKSKIIEELLVLEKYKKNNMFFLKKMIKNIFGYKSLFLLEKLKSNTVS